MTKENLKNLWQDNIEKIPDTPDSGNINICIVDPLFMIRGSGLKGNCAEGSISELGDSSVYKVIMIERQGTIRHGLVPK
jgi:hypothetical protein